MDEQKFERAKEAVGKSDNLGLGIGTLKEGTLHAVVKHYIEDNINFHEVKVGRFVADIKRENEIIEIQTRQFSKLRKKLECFLEMYQVTIVYPISHVKWLSWIDVESGEVSPKRKSPKKGSPYEIFFELYKIKDLLIHPSLSICIVLIDMEEYKLLNGWSRDKKRGAYRKDRIPTQLIEEINISCPQDYKQFIPHTLNNSFTSKDFKKHTKLSLRSAQLALNVLTYLSVVERIGKKGNAYIYKISST
ncbi:hypothetical protein [Cellulosilyticum sp. I15G10I2]|uniref:hypothetical protein n=1 Tax=Cellulosilyticum sp. I15G10I2 TaxID=1892843 RepID=UPI00085C143E|nr:hypothetical protein [Cellulosilyticum sp. I15G10I2]